MVFSFFTNTKTKILSPIPRLFWDQYWDFFETKIFETDTGTFLDQMFSTPILRLFLILKFSRPILRLWNFGKLFQLLDSIFVFLLQCFIFVKFLKCLFLLFLINIDKFSQSENNVLVNFIMRKKMREWIWMH